MPITPTPPYPKSSGDAIRSADWNQAVDEVIRLDNAKVDRAGDTITGSLAVNADFSSGGNATVTGTLTVTGNVGIGAAADASLHVGNFISVGPFVATQGVGGIDLTGPGSELGLVRRSLNAWPNAPAAGDRFVWYNPDGSARLWDDVNGDLMVMNSNGNLSLTRGSLTLPKSAAGTSQIGNLTFDNEGTFKNNIKVLMGSSGLIIGPGLEYEFHIGHSFFGFIINGGSFNNFISRFSVNQNGDVNIPGHLTVGGGKTGYIVDNFINNTMDEMEEGDVIVISDSLPVSIRPTGQGNNIPVFEAMLCNQAYDNKVCGIVSRALVEGELPYIEPKIDMEEQKKLFAAYQAEQKKIAKASKTDKSEKAPLAVSTGAAAEAPLPPKGQPIEQPPHPLKEYAAPLENLDRSKVSSHRIGQMVTLGCYAHCKVDADIAPISAGDLLTTSPTKGHAQKVLDRSLAMGTIIGKALEPLAKGKGVISIFVMMQ